MLLTGFSPIIAPETRLLILGSMPGVESLRQRQYYAHPRNTFWLIMGALVGALPELDYNERVVVLKKNRISLWDVIDRCVRPGSLDGDIERESETVNPLIDFCRDQPELRALAFNGRKARETFNRHFMKKDPVLWPSAAYRPAFNQSGLCLSAAGGQTQNLAPITSAGFGW